MARRKASSRITPVRPTRRAGAWDAVFLNRQDQDRQYQGDNRYNTRDSIGQTPRTGNYRQSMFELPEIRGQAEALTDDYMQNAIEMAINGDTEELLPYQPTPTINPGRPRTLAAGYDEKSMTLRIQFRSGEVYTYYRVPPSVWWKFQRAQSPGRYINSTLNGYPYSRGVY
jgi:hypothetical protein